jgi:hypothetical protein
MMRITPQEVAAKVEPIMAHYGLKPVPFIRAPSRSSVSPVAISTLDLACWRRRGAFCG